MFVTSICVIVSLALELATLHPLHSQEIYSYQVHSSLLNTLKWDLLLNQYFNSSL